MSIQELEERAPLTAADLEALRVKHGRITHVRYNGFDIVFRKPNAGEAQLYRATLGADAESRYEAMSQMAQFINVVPGAEGLNELIEEYPFMYSNEVVNEAISKAMGVLEEKKDSRPPSTPKKATPNASPLASPIGSLSAREAS